MPTSSKKKSFFERTKLRYKKFMDGRTHRSFRLTRRRDAVQELELPGNIAFTHEVNKTLWAHKKTFLLLGVLYAVLFGLLVGVQSQDTFSQLTQTLSEAGDEITSGEWGAFEQAGGVLLTMSTAGVSTDATEGQQIFSVLISLLVWLTSVWLLRNLLAGHKVKLRDGLYNAGSPLFATILIALVMAVQMLPIALAVIGYSAASASGLLEAGAIAMMFWVAAGLLGILSLYWLTSSLFALIIITVPGIYPMQALRSAGGLVLGRRVRMLLRWLWMALVLALTWVAVLFPFIFLDMGIKALWPAIEWLPILPYAILLLSSFTVVWSSAYVYLLYRRVVEYVPA